MHNILVIDDEMNIRTSLARELRFHNYNVLRAETGLEALSVLERQKVDLILLDLNMPVMSGLDFLKAVTQEYPHARIIVLSGSVTGDDVQKILPFRKNVVDIMAKPWDNDKLIRIIDFELKNKFNSYP